MGLKMTRLGFKRSSSSLMGPEISGRTYMVRVSISPSMSLSSGITARPSIFLRLGWMRMTS